VLLKTLDDVAYSPQNSIRINHHSRLSTPQFYASNQNSSRLFDPQIRVEMVLPPKHPQAMRCGSYMSYRSNFNTNNKEAQTLRSNGAQHSNIFYIKETIMEKDFNEKREDE
jgi:hypothetical protein